jgi:FkbM family methyltransferase
MSSTTPTRRSAALVGRFKLWRIQRRLAGNRLLRAFARDYPEAFFVEVGANDGEQEDQLRPFILKREWRGIMVEPVPWIFARLRENYGHLDRVALANVAIADRDGTLPFYHLAEAAEGERVPPWYHTIGSFSREAVLGHANRIRDIERRLVETEVATLTFDSLLARHGVDRVDLLLTDTEGHDWEIIRNVDLAAHRPRLVVYEHYHLPVATREHRAGHMDAAGYDTLEEGFDTFCLRREDDRLTQAFRELEPLVGGVYAEEDGSRA